RHQHLFYVASPSRHILSASLGLILIALAGLGLFLPQQFVILPGVGILSLAFLVIYLFSIRLIFRFDTLLRAGESQVTNDAKQIPSLKRLSAYYTLFALVIISAAVLIPHFAEKIAEQTGLSSSFIGTVFVAISTSLPEIAVSVAAVRFGSVDLAIGNLLGSNIFNVLILSVDDLFYTKGILLKDASEIHLVSVFACMIMTAIAIAGFTYRAPEKKFLMALDAVLILAVYIMSLAILFYLS
ncbi:MAG: sodium:calcium antiporter, partial [Chitinophagaceae bacterium]